MNDLQHAKILNAFTTYDRKQSTKKGYNFYALGHYCKALSNAQKHCDNGADLRLSLLNCFCGRLLDVCLKSVNLDKSTKEEAFVGGFEKLPYIEEDD